jgi:hypothetical protein
MAAPHSRRSYKRTGDGQNGLEPTLIAAAGTAPAADYLTDGMNLLPHLVSNAPVVERRLF